MGRPQGERRGELSLAFCVTGSIAAATSAATILQLLVKRKLVAEIHVVLSERARRFVSEEALAVIAGRRCVIDLFDEAKKGRAAHVEIARACNMALVAPASANLIGKLAHGICDDTVTCLLSVFNGPVILAPAVHPETSAKRSFLRNLKQVRQDGALICGPVEGTSLSENKSGPDILGMPPPEVIVAYIEYMMATGNPPDVPFREYSSVADRIR